MTRPHLKISLFLLLTITFLQGESVTRLSFSHPGNMMRIPVSSVYRTPYVFRTGFASDTYGFSDTLIAKGIFFEADLTNTFKVGLTTVQGIAGTRPVEFGLHLQKRIFSYGDISFAAGIHDMVVRQGEKNLNIGTETLSLFALLSNEKQFTNSTLHTYMGFGTGSLASTFGADSTTNMGVFAGILVHTNIRKDQGGVAFIVEFDGGGLNIGSRIPLTQDYNLSIGLNNAAYLYNFGSKNYSTTAQNRHPSLSLSLDFTIPRIKPENIKRRTLEGMVNADTKAILDVEEQFAAKLDSTLKAADFEIAKLRDSLRVYESQIKYLNSQVAQLKQKSAVLEDSVRSAKLAKYAMERNINLALKHLSNSLSYFYSGDYQQALKEVDAAIELNPNLALAYARRGSIYYKMGDIERASINWNIALKIDPEYDDVRNILRAMSENRLRSVGGEQKE
ncbi:MAG TPA: tetratricopeptide repeat protein [Candidatus Marinimicrobia bacterium]|nr:tetratricopeptide repeat protein [Candidatus Neomarinimicrobiota bacterium]HRS51992.1 tetratricopeptide repeat protein [Candidatus Neomarinimicrobiota bacterium]HRU91879.1 tetratricopeptide repeat protein [Candidatus Neomarinimicrobiota bacterium]